jgi:hypothetical protein
VGKAADAGGVGLRLAECQRTRDDTPLEWASTQANLGYTLQTLGEREGGTAWLKEAVVAYSAALAVYEPAGPSGNVQTVRRNLAIAGRLIAERSSGG